MSDHVKNYTSTLFFHVEQNGQNIFRGCSSGADLKTEAVSEQSPLPEFREQLRKNISLRCNREWRRVSEWIIIRIAGIAGSRRAFTSHLNKQYVWCHPEYWRNSNNANALLPLLFSQSLHIFNASHERSARNWMTPCWHCCGPETPF